MARCCTSGRLSLAQSSQYEKACAKPALNTHAETHVDVERRHGGRHRSRRTRGQTRPHPGEGFEGICLFFPHCRICLEKIRVYGIIILPRVHDIQEGGQYMYARPLTVRCVATYFSYRTVLIPVKQRSTSAVVISWQVVFVHTCEGLW